MSQAKNKYCKNSFLHTNISNQNDCQSLCLGTIACAGIAYSNNGASSSLCYICKDDILSFADNWFAFYRRPGKNFS